MSHEFRHAALPDPPRPVLAVPAHGQLDQGDAEGFFYLAPTTAPAALQPTDGHDPSLGSNRRSPAPRGRSAPVLHQSTHRPAQDRVDGFVGDRRNRMLAWLWETLQLPAAPVSAIIDHRPVSQITPPVIPFKCHSGDDSHPVTAVVDDRREIVDDALCCPPGIWPLVLTGPSGVGKSLVARCLAVSLADRRGCEPLVINGVDFARSYQQAVEINAVSDWRLRWISTPVMVVDQLPTLSDSILAQQQLCEILDQRLLESRPTIFVSLTSPARSSLSDRLVSRLSLALICPIAPPGPAALAVLALQAFDRLGVAISPEQIQLLILSGLRDVPTLHKVAHRWFLEQGRQPFLWEAASPALKQLLGSTLAALPTAEGVLKATAKHFQLTIKDLRGSSRTAACSRARALAMWVCRQYLKMSYQQIGDLFGQRDHSTVLSSCRKIESLLPTDRFLQTSVQQLLFRTGLQ